jgi:protein-disulfide isomerase
VSDKQEREKRKAARLQEETQVHSQDRRARLLQLGAGAVFLVLAVVVVLIVVNASSNGDSGDTKLEEVGSVDSLLSGIPQAGLVLGDPKAKVELIEFGDLQCPVCKGFSEEILPQVIENKIASGEAKLVFRNFPIINEESVPAGAAAIAAGAQGRGWNYIELFYRNQGEENSGYISDEFMTAITKGAGVRNIAQWNTERKAPKATEEVEKTQEEARDKFEFEGTPSFALTGPGTDGIEILDLKEDPGYYEQAIEEAA